ncbi:MAG: sigma-70 family RNA polymerase sigma factor [Candidatus Schekmanbacteria bacterium]|nr:sigma-70 family RNA polymerase sigma factor [Candidatus Schekmanbacteria bacterium]
MFLKQEAPVTNFEKIALPHLDFIYKSAYRFCGNATDAEDLTQETFQVAFEKFSQLRDLAKCRSWLFMIMRRLYLKEIERSKRYTIVDFEDSNYDIDHIKSIGEKQLRHVIDGELQNTLNKLDKRYKVPLVLSYLGEFSYQEIADMLKIPIGTVMSRIARAKIYLKKELTKSL